MRIAINIGITEANSGEFLVSWSNNRYEDLKSTLLCLRFIVYDELF